MVNTDGRATSEWEVVMVSDHQFIQSLQNDSVIIGFLTQHHPNRRIPGAFA